MNLEIKKRLCKSKLSTNLNSDQLDLLLSNSKLLSFQPEDIILKAGHQCDGIYLLIEGEIAGFIHILGKGAIDIEQFAEGDYIGDISLIENKTTVVSYRAKNHLICLYISHLYLNVLAEFSPDFYYKLIKSLAETTGKFLIKKQHQLVETIKALEPQNQYANLLRHIQSYRRLKKCHLNEIDISMEEIQQTELFKYFTPHEFNNFLKLTTIYEGQKNGLLIKEGTKQPSYFLILRGAVQTRIVSHRRFVKISVLAPFSFFGSLSCILDAGSIVSYITCERSIILKIDFNDLMEFQQKNLNVWFKVNHLIYQSAFLLNSHLNQAYIRLNNEPYRQEKHV